MNEVANALVLSVLQRWDSDPQRFSALMSKEERDAIESLLGSDVIDPTSSKLQEPDAELEKFDVERTALLRTTIEHPEMTVCFDFGTARSKVFAVAAFPDGETDLIEIPIGELDNDIDESVYAIASSVWIDNSGFVFVGSEAIRRSHAAMGNGSRSRIDSLKHLVSLAASEEQVTNHLFPSAQNPTEVLMTLDDVLVFFLAYLTDLASSYLKSKQRGRYVRRRFTLPCWPANHRSWSTAYLADRIAVAQVVADTFSGQWPKGIHARFVQKCVRKSIELAGNVRYLIDQDPDAPKHLSKRWGGILEPLAAGSTTFWRGKNSKEAFLVLDVGAGATDLSLFWIPQRLHGTANSGRRGFPIIESEAIRVAGDDLDHTLVGELLRRADLDKSEGEQKQAEAALRLFGVRRLKEQLFTERKLRHRMSNDLVVEITLDEFMGLKLVREFQEALESNVRSFLAKVDNSWKKVETIQMVLTGGGSDLPMVKRLAGMSLPIGGGDLVKLVAAPRVPHFLADYDEALSQEYPQLAVAIGGALPETFDEPGGTIRYPGEA